MQRVQLYRTGAYDFRSLTIGQNQFMQSIEFVQQGAQMTHNYLLGTIHICIYIYRKHRV